MKAFFCCFIKHEIVRKQGMQLILYLILDQGSCFIWLAVPELSNVVCVAMQQYNNFS